MGHGLSGKRRLVLRELRGMKKTIQELTGLRGVAALLILIGHSVAVAPVLKTWPTAPLMNVLTLCGMSVFFILSGIVICYNYHDDTESSCPFRSDLPYGLGCLQVVRSSDAA